jgi:hypothetical protein
MTVFAVQSNLTKLTNVTTNTYSLNTMASYLESILDAMGYAQLAAPASTREARRKRFRKLNRIFKGLVAREVCFGAAPIPSASDAVFGAEGFVISQPLCLPGSYAMSTRVSQPPGGYDIDKVAASRATPPFLGDTRFTRLDVALRLDREGPESFFETVMAYWARRHDVVVKPGSPDKRPRRRLAIDRLFQALMRFAFGFFGSNKVDARNNP